MVRILAVCAVALSVSAALARSSQQHRLVARRNKLAARQSQCVAKHGSSTSNQTSSESTSNTSGTTSESSYDPGSSSSSSTTSGSSSSTTTTTDGSSATTTTASTTTRTTTTHTSTHTASSAGSTLPSSIAGVFPPSSTKIVAGWTVADMGSATVDNVQAFPFNDDTLLETGNMSKLPHPVVSEDGVQAIKSYFNKGSYELQTSGVPLGGFSFYSPGPKLSGSTPAVNLPSVKATEVSFGYSVKFSAGFEYNQGGKLPGLFGGTTYDIADTCSGGKHAEACFSTRLMFRPNGQGELYLYVPPSANRANLCGSTGTGACEAPDAGVTYGASVGTGNFHFTSGSWTQVREVIHMNTVGKQDGWAKVYVNGASDPAISIDKIAFAADAGTWFQGAQLQNFFGGHTTAWASPQDQTVWFADFTLAVTDTS